MTGRAAIESAIREYAAEAERIYTARTAGDKTWEGLLATFCSTVADDLRAEGAAEALHAALYDLKITQSNHDAAECAAPVPGEVGRQDAIDEWISICEEPVEWMRKFAQRYAHEAPSDAYIREVEEEARAEGRREVFDALRMFRDEADKPLAVDLGSMVRAWLDEREGINHG